MINTFHFCSQEELTSLQTDLEKLEVSGGDNTMDDKERNDQIETQYEADKTKLHKMRLAIVSYITIRSP